MKLRVAVLLFLFLFSCKTKRESHIDAKVSFHWLLGDWIRINNKEGQQTYEQWQWSDNRYYGLGYTLENRDTIFREDILLYFNNGKWQFTVSGVNEQPVTFPVTYHRDEHFICENVLHDFPQKIEYKLSNDTLYAAVSGGGNLISFRFVKHL